ncbi:hypothetical protein J6590_041525 [Homalodisca vitripennis]|nr:hypothetical protein J6590_041525 [Homalodisca vitripennis]
MLARIELNRHQSPPPPPIATRILTIKTSFFSSRSTTSAIFWVLAIPNLSESPRPPATPSISLDEIGESQEHNISNILAVPDLSESTRPPATPSGPSEQSEEIISKPGL